jgi:hypothetical protein
VRYTLVFYIHHKREGPNRPWVGSSTGERANSREARIRPPPASQPTPPTEGEQAEAASGEEGPSETSRWWVAPSPTALASS